MEKTFETNNVALAGQGNWFTSTLETIRARYAQYAIYRQTVRELSGLSDRALADLGLSRSMIRELARENAYGA
ncbi:DUF1127 domain-containing protein [Tropicimonas sp.]|uniref:DUF1127 domain-containing protein n=1 Tax=Tropicimonas sp. TaxID=2067044 RepID=UPI003A88346F